MVFTLLHLFGSLSYYLLFIDRLYIKQIIDEIIKIKPVVTDFFGLRVFTKKAVSEFRCLSC